MILYLLKSAGCLLILLLVHRLILQREAIYQFNRFFLLAAVIGSFLIPLVEIEVPAEAAIATLELVQNADFSAEYQEFPFQEMEGVPAFHASEVEQGLDWNSILWGIYGLVTLVFLIRFLRNIHLLFDKIHRNIHVQFRGETLVLLQENTLPFSFLSYIFVSQDYFESDQLTDSIFAHEQAHVRGRHSWDNLLIESLLVVFWFHPGLYLARQAIKLNHEFIADAAALQITPLDQYKSFLLRMMLPEKSHGLASSLNFSLTKKRFQMMKRKTANSTKWMMILGVIPVFVVLVYVFSEKIAAQAGDEVNSEVAIIDLTANQNETQILIRTDGKIEVDGQVIELAQLPAVINSKNSGNTIAHIFADLGVKMGIVADVQETLKEMEIRRVIYEGIVNQKSDQDAVYTLIYDFPIQSLTKAEYYSETKFRAKYPNGEFEEFSYDDLPENYKNDLPNPPGEVKKNIPSSALFESWKNGKEFAIWIDGKVTPNSKLEEMKASDVVHYFSSFVHSNARSERFPQNYQVNIYTLSGFENAYGKNSSFGKKPMGGTLTIGSVSPKKEKVKVSFSSNQYIPTSTSYQKQATEFQLKISNASMFTSPSEKEIEALRAQFLALDQTYFNLSIEERRKVSRVSFPYAKIEKDGQIKYKKFEYLNPEERQALGC